MAQTLVKFTEPVRGSDGKSFDAQACGDIAEDGLWQGWIEFTSGAETIRTERETEQPNLADLEYWAQGLSMVYLQGALARALNEPLPESQERTADYARPGMTGPDAPRVVAARPVLNPFLVYAEGEELLRQQLQALSRDHLIAIIEWYNLPVSVDPRAASAAVIAEDITRTLREARRPKRPVGSEQRAG